MYQLCQRNFYTQVLLNTAFHRSCVSHLLQIFVFKPHGLQPVQPRAPYSRAAFPAELPPGAPLPPLRGLLEIFPAGLLRFFLRGRPYLDLVGDAWPRPGKGKKKKKKTVKKSFHPFRDLSIGKILLRSRSACCLINSVDETKAEEIPTGGRFWSPYKSLRTAKDT